MKNERGFTLLELLVALGIVTILATAAFAGFATVRRSSVHAAGRQFDALLAYARSLAATSGNGATIVFLPSSHGTVLQVYAGRPTAAGSVRQSALPAQTLPAAFSEGSLGLPPFTLFLDTAGSASGAGSYPPLDGGRPRFVVLPLEPACPRAGTYTLVLAARGAKELRPVPCRR